MESLELFRKFYPNTKDIKKQAFNNLTNKKGIVSTKTLQSEYDLIYNEKINEYNKHKGEIYKLLEKELSEKYALTNSDSSGNIFNISKKLSNNIFDLVSIYEQLCYELY